MNNDDDLDVLDVSEAFHRYTPVRPHVPHRTLTWHFRRFMPEETIHYIQYCVLRVPLLLLYDYLLTEQYSTSIQSAFNNPIDISDEQQESLFYLTIAFLQNVPLQLFIEFNVYVSIPIIGILLLTLLLLLSDRNLFIFYSYTVSCLVIYFSYQIQCRVDTRFNLFLLQLLLVTIYICLLRVRYRVHSTIIQEYLCYLTPILFLMNHYYFSLSSNIPWLNIYCVVWMFVHLSEVFIFRREALVHLIQTEFSNQLLTLYDNGGLQLVLNYLQENISFIKLLQIFWLTKILVVPLGIRSICRTPYLNQTINTNDLLLANLNETIETTISYNETLTKTVYFTVIYYGTETVLTLISLACLVSSGVRILSHRLFRLLHLWSDDMEYIGIVTGVIFFLLLFQSNLIRLDLDRRHIPLLKASNLILVALFHFLHNVLEPILLKVAMQTMLTSIIFDQTVESEDKSGEDRTKKKAISIKIDTMMKTLRSFDHRHVYTCLTIILFLNLYLVCLWRLTTFSTWLLAITGFSLELIVRLLGSLTQYALYLLDGQNLLSDDDTLDEYVFRTKAVTSCFEFVIGILLLFNGFYVLIFEAHGILRAFMLVTHAYLNIVKKFRRGWQTFENRRSALGNVNRLRMATEERIQNYNCVCSICLSTLTIDHTCVTPCGHLFHRKCLKKAFYANQNCPLCSRQILSSNKNSFDEH